MLKITVKAPGKDFWTRFGVLLLLACVAYWTMFSSRMPYCDDALRIYTHTSINQGVHGRPLADVVYGLLTGGLFTDAAPISQILAIACLLGAGFVVARVFVGAAPESVAARRLYWLGPLFFTLLPLNLFILNFHFDSIGMALALFCAVGAFGLLAMENNFWRVILASILMWCSLAMYQPMTGSYFVCAGTWLGALCLNERLREILRKMFYLALAPLFGALAYLPVYFQARANADMPFCGLPNHVYAQSHARSIKDDFFGLLGQNIDGFLQAAQIYARPNVLTFCVFAIAAIALCSLLLKKACLPRKALALVFLVLAFFACGMMEMMLANAIFPGRALVTLCVFCLCLLYLGLIHDRTWISRLLPPLCVLSIVFSALMLAAYGNAQRDQYEFEEQTVLLPLWQDIANEIEARRKDGEVFKFFVKGQFPLHSTLRKVNENYYFIATPSNGLFIAMRLLSWLPLEYDLVAALGEATPADYPLLVSRIGYDIRLYNPDTFMVVLHRDFAPEKVKPFESARYFGAAGK